MLLPAAYARISTVPCLAAAVCAPWSCCGGNGSEVNVALLDRRLSLLVPTLQRYEELYETTDKANGGTLYLQSKVFRAREAIFTDLDVDINELDKFAAPADGVDPAAAAADPAATPPPASEDKPDKSA